MRQVRALQVGLVVVVLCICGTVAFFVMTADRSDPARAQRHAGSTSPKSDQQTDPDFAADTKEIVRDFSGTRYDKDQRKLTYRADLARSAKDGETEFVGNVQFESIDKSGLEYRLSAAAASVTQDWKFWRATGGVEVDRSDGASLRSSWAEHYEREKAEVVGGGVLAHLDDRSVSCERAEFRAPSDEFLLDGDVRIVQRQDDGVTFLSAQHVRYARGSGQVFVNDSVSLARSNLAVHSKELEVSLNGSILWRAVFRGVPENDVMLETWSVPDGCDEPQAWYKAAWTRGLEVEFDETGRARTIRSYPTGTYVYVEGMDAPRSLWSIFATGSEATLAADGRVESLVAQSFTWKSAELHDNGEAKESLYADIVHAKFDRAGSLQVAEFDQGLTIHRLDELKLVGAHATYTDKDVLVIDSDPVLETKNSTLKAKRLEYFRRTGNLRARGDVDVESKRDKVAGGVLGGVGEPIRIRAQEMDTESGGKVTYRVQARAWSGRDLLTADEIRVADELSGLEAEGNVVLLLSTANEMVEARAKKLVFAGQTANLSGNVRIQSSDLNLESDVAELLFADGGGGVRVVDAIGDEVIGRRLGRTTYSHRLRHDVQTGKTVLYGGDRLARIVTDDGHEGIGNLLELWSDGQRIHIGSDGKGFAQTRVEMGTLERKPAGTGRQ